MPGMSRNHAASTLQGFSVFQPALGSALQWLPALGSYELDEMLHTFLPGPASIQDKRAHISMDFYEFARQTGETFKFYPVYTASFASATVTGSPASSSAMHDSGYGSSFNVSPVVSSMSPWTPALSASTPASTASEARTKSRSGPSRRTTPTGSRGQLDFSNHPGMRILTKDGRDITHSASRGCKSKEQRDHAHLMRIIKACDGCRRKKIRCDPSHKKWTSSQTQPSRPGPKQAKKAKTAMLEPTAQDFNLVTPSSLDLAPSFEAEVTPAAPSSSESLNPDDFWQQYVYLDDSESSDLVSLDWGLDPARPVASSNGSSSASPAQPFLPSAPGLVDNYGVMPDLVSEALALPYLNPGDSYGTHYQDFTLYSPTSELLDEEPQFVRKPRRQGHSTGQQANTAESGLRHTTPEPPNIHDHAYLYGGQSQQQGGLPEMNAAGWSHVNAVDYTNGLHETVPTDPHPGEMHSRFAVSRQPRPQPSALPGSSQRPSPASPPENLDPVPSRDGRIPRAALAILARYARYATALTPSAQQDLISSHTNARLYSSRRVDIPSPLPTVSQPVDVRTRRPLTGLAQTSASLFAKTVGDSPSAVQSEAMKDDVEGAGRGAFAPAAHPQAAPVLVRRGLRAPSTTTTTSSTDKLVCPTSFCDKQFLHAADLDRHMKSVHYEAAIPTMQCDYRRCARHKSPLHASVSALEQRGCSAVVARDRAADSLVTGIASYEPDGANHAGGKTASVGLQEVPHAARSAPSASLSRALPHASMHAVVAAFVAPSPSIHEGAIGVPSAKYRTPLPGTATTSVNSLAALGLVSCLLVLLLRWASLVCQHEMGLGLGFGLLLALSPSVSSYSSRVLHEHNMDTVHSALAKRAGLLWRSIGGRTARCLVGQ